ncbi:MAG: hypothetical protein ACREEX_13680 [Caulobacteraceae bacterium]
MRTTRREATIGVLLLAGWGFAAPASWADQADELPNVFISPCGEPFRAKPGAPYPVIDWFHEADANHDGKLTREEFNADAGRFFKKLDLNGDGVLSPQEVALYERAVCPEILGLRVIVGWASPFPTARLQLAQMMGQAPGPSMGQDQGVPIPPPTTKAPDDAATQGASPFSFFNEPEPVMAADFSFSGLITSAEFQKLSNVHFDDLDIAKAGFLTLAGLPQTPMEERIEKASSRRRTASFLRRVPAWPPARAA